MKRYVLQAINEDFDPVGHPYLKQNCMHVMRNDLNWDKELPEIYEIRARRKWNEDWMIKILRYYLGPFYESDVEKVELHLFSEAYGAVAYNLQTKMST